MSTEYQNSIFSLPFKQRIYDNFEQELKWSSDMVIGIVLSGSIGIHSGNKTRIYQQYDILFFMPFTPFSVLSFEPGTKVFALSVQLSFVQEMIPDYSKIDFRQHHVSHDLRNEIYYKLCCHFSTIIFDSLKNNVVSRFHMLNAVSDMISTLLESYGTRMEKNVQRDYISDRTKDILLYITQNYAGKITVRDIASHLGIHPQYFSSIFSKYFHSSFSDYMNNFRINASMNQLLNTKESITNIALEHGFSNHKTYASAFRKIHGLSPTEYRREHSALLSEKAQPGTEHQSTTDTSGVYSYFLQFLNEDNQSIRHNYNNMMQKRQTLHFHPEELSHHARHHQQFCCISARRAVACLRSDLQIQITQAHKDLNIDYLRIRDIFSDSLYVYFENEKNEPLFNWQALDTVFDFVISLGIHPFPEIGYMPEKLASKKHYAALFYHPNVSFPKSLENWQKLIRSFLTHYLERYGNDEVEQWYFDFWTSPDLPLEKPYWYGSQEEFFEFYKATYDIFQEVNPNLCLGSPNFSTISGYPWYDAFFSFCEEKHIKPAYVSTHIYGCRMLENLPVLSGDFNDIDSNFYTITNQNLANDYLIQLHDIMNQHSLYDMNIIVSDYNLSFMPQDLIRDTCYMGAYFAHTAFLTMDKVKILGHWCLSDIHEDSYLASDLFWGGPGLMDYHGLKKASYNTLALLGKLGNTILAQGTNYLLAQSGSTYQLYLYNLIEFDNFYTYMDKSALDNTHRYNIFSHTEALYFNIILHLPQGTYSIRKSEVNRNYGSSYDLWGQMGCPASLTKDIEDYLRDKSVPNVTYSVQKAEQTLILDEVVPAHGVLLLEIKKQ